MGHWPEAWARMGDRTTTASPNPAKSMSLSFRAQIEGSHYERKVYYQKVFSPPSHGEFLARVQWWEKYPSGGSVQYSAHAYYKDGEKVSQDGEWKDFELDTRGCEFFRIDAKEGGGMNCIECGQPLCEDCSECHNTDCEQYTPCE